MGKIRTFVLAIAMGLAILPFFGGFTQTAFAEPNTQQAVCKGIGGCSDAKDDTKLQSTIEKIINLLSVIAGIAAVIMIIVGGFRYVTSGGDSGTVSSAKNTVIYALIGIVVVAAAQVLVKFVLSSLL